MTTEAKRPSDFMKHPFDSVMQNCESETVARNIMVILSRTGNTFRDLTWREYKKERSKDRDSDAVDMEKGYFQDVIKYCKSPDTATCFSKTWSSQ